MKKLFERIILVLSGIFLFARCSNDAPKNEIAVSISAFDTIFPVVYNKHSSDNGDYAFRTIPQQHVRVKLIPNMETREKMRLKKIGGIIGIHQFLLDHDLISGFVHRYTQNMFNNLKPNDFVLKFYSDSAASITGTISFIRKNEMTAADSLGKNIAFFRQWRLSDINYTLKGDEIVVHMDTCKYYTRCVCPASKPGSGRPPQIPIWHKGTIGEQPLSNFAAFGSEDGGTVVLVWESEDGIWFQDIHSSWKEILGRAISISKDFNCDPAICISDAGPFARKIRANNFKVNVSDIDALSPYGHRFGAGYGYLASEK